MTETPTHPVRTGNLNGVSVDVEDYRQILAWRYRRQCPPVAEEFVRNMEQVMDLLGRASATATFFVTGPVARDRPALLRQWLAAGHEIACHGASHMPIWTMDAAALRADLLEAKARIEDATDSPVAGYRAPAFSIRRDTTWALATLAECGFTFDSSIVPVRVRRYGITGFPRRPVRVVLAGGRRITEVPLAVGRVAGRQIPIGGGGYFRLFSFERINRAVVEAEREGVPFVMYFHPDEIGGTFSAGGLAGGPADRLRARLLTLRSNIGRRKVRPTVTRLLAGHRFATLGRLAEGATDDLSM